MIRLPPARLQAERVSITTKEHLPMLERFIDREIRRTNRNLLLLSGCSALLLLLVCGATWRYWYNFVGGPTPISPEALSAIQDPSAETRYFVTAQGDKTVPTGLREITVTRSKYTRTERSRRTTAQYVALLVRGRKALLVKSPTETSATTFSGALQPIPTDIRNRLGKDVDVFLPYMMDAGSFRSAGYWALGLCGPLMLLSLFGLSRALRRTSDPSQHPLMKRLASLGQATDVAAHIDREISGPPGAVPYGPALLTQSFTLRCTAFSTSVMRHQDLIWIHGKVTRHSTNGIPTGTSYAVLLHDRHGETLEVSCKEPAMAQLLQELKGRVPWALFGHSPELEGLWKSRRQELVAQVDARRQSA